MPVHRYRSVAEMPPPWREPDDPSNLRRVALMIAWCRKVGARGPARAPGVRRFRSMEEANAGGDDPYRQPRSGIE